MFDITLLKLSPRLAKANDSTFPIIALEVSTAGFQIKDKYATRCFPACSIFLLNTGLLCEFGIALHRRKHKDIDLKGNAVSSTTQPETWMLSMSLTQPTALPTYDKDTHDKETQVKALTYVHDELNTIDEHWPYSPVRKYSKPCLRALRSAPYDSPPYVSFSLRLHTERTETGKTDGS